MENEAQMIEFNGNDLDEEIPACANPLLATGRCCINCKSYCFIAPQHGQPYPEFTCLKGYWDEISCEEDYDELFNEINCKDFVRCI